MNSATGNYGKRHDGSTKGNGWLGPIKMPNGKVMTELSIGVNIDGKEVEIPSIVPTLDKTEIDFLKAGNSPTKSIVKKAVDHAKQRMSQNLSPYADNAAFGYPVMSAKETGLDSYFKKNTNVAGLAWGAGLNGSDPSLQRSIVVNPYNKSISDPLKKQGLIKLEAARHVMDEMQYVPDFKLTKEQKEWQKSLGAYSKDDNAFKQSIVSRIIVGDEVPGITDEQKISALVVEKDLQRRLK